jgi:tRNA pseudouridine13 synthase
MTERLPRGRIKATPEDFVVDELPAYLPSGEGEHLYIRFTKTNLTTDAAVRAIAGALRVNPRECGVAGMKDKAAVTTQWMSVHAMDRTMDARAEALAVDGITVREVKRHGNKLKTGHLAGNRFEIVVRGVAAEDAPKVVETLKRLGDEGLPNAFGYQRFGREGDNADRARAWLTGKERGPRDPRQRRFLWSALQSAVFNAVLDVRVADGTWRIPLEGDLLKTTNGGLFVCTDVQTDTARAARGEVTPTGPIVGVKMKQAAGRPAEIEREVAARVLGDGFDLSATKALGEGTRRVLRLGIEAMKVELRAPAGEQDAGIGVYFVLPKGSFATTVLGAALDLENAPETAPETPESGAGETTEA